MLKFEDITPEQAAMLTMLCSEVQPIVKDRQSNGYMAIIWCNTIGEHISADGKTVLEAVVNAHNKVKKINFEHYGEE